MSITKLNISQYIIYKNRKVKKKRMKKKIHLTCNNIWQVVPSTTNLCTQWSQQQELRAGVPAHK